MRRIDLQLFYSNSDTTWSTVQNNDQEAVLQSVKWLFDNNMLSHFLSKAYAKDAELTTYWERYSKDWRLVDLDADGTEELLFSGETIQGDDRENVQIYSRSDASWQLIFERKGALAGFVQHPRTKEVLPIHHRYPCCSQYTHTLRRLRFVQGEFQELKKYFIASDAGGMAGPFFPDSTAFPSTAMSLQKRVSLRWSPNVVTEKAYYTAVTNEVIAFESGSLYLKLAEKGNWWYVLFLTPPPLEQSPVVNTANLQSSKLLGWIQAPDK